MEHIEITSISSRGQVVIPQGLRERLKIREGEKFIVIGEDNTIVLKKVEMPSFKGFDKLLAKTREFAEKNELKEIDVEQAVRNSRKK
jgi:antitoxin PrlF